MRMVVFEDGSPFLHDVMQMVKVWARNSDVDNDRCASCFGKYSHDGNEDWIGVVVSY